MLNFNFIESSHSKIIYPDLNLTSTSTTNPLPIQTLSQTFQEHCPKLYPKPTPNPTLNLVSNSTAILTLLHTYPKPKVSMLESIKITC